MSCKHVINVCSKTILLTQHNQEIATRLVRGGVWAQDYGSTEMLVFNEVRCLVGGTRLGQQVTFVLIVTLITLVLILNEQQLMLSYILAHVPSPVIHQFTR